MTGVASGDIQKSTRKCPFSLEYCLPTCGLAVIRFSKLDIFNDYPDIKWVCGLSRRHEGCWVYPKS